MVCASAYQYHTGICVQLACIGRMLSLRYSSEAGCYMTMLCEKTIQACANSSAVSSVTEDRMLLPNSCCGSKLNVVALLFNAVTAGLQHSRCLVCLVRLAQDCLGCMPRQLQKETLRVGEHVRSTQSKGSTVVLSKIGAAPFSLSCTTPSNSLCCMPNVSPLHCLSNMIV